MFDFAGSLPICFRARFVGPAEGRARAPDCLVAWFLFLRGYSVLRQAIQARAPEQGGSSSHVSGTSCHPTERIVAHFCDPIHCDLLRMTPKQ